MQPDCASLYNVHATAPVTWGITVVTELFGVFAVNVLPSWILFFTGNALKEGFYTSSVRRQADASVNVADS